MSNRIRIATLDAESPQGLSAMQAWRDGTLAPALASGAGRPHLYTAFNVPHLAAIAQASALQRPALPAAPPGVRMALHEAELAYEYRQPGTEGQVDSPVLYSVRFKVPAEWRDEFDRWYEQEHIPMIYECRHWAMGRRYCYAGEGPQGATHLTLHYLSDVRGLDAPQLMAARGTPWRKKFLGERWFTDVGKMIYLRQEG